MSDIFSKGNLTAGITVFYDAARPSSITLPVVPLSALPEFPVLDAVESMLARHAPKWEANVARSARQEGDVDFKAWLTRRVAKALAFTTGRMAGSSKQ